MMSASMSDVGRYMGLMAFRSQASRTKWKQTLICLVRSLCQNKVASGDEDASGHD